MTATPHNGYAESFSALLELIDNQRFARGIPPAQDQLRAIMIRRLKSELPPRWNGTPQFPTRQLKAIEVEYTEEEKQVHRWLTQYIKLRQRHAKDNAEKFATEFVLKLLKKRLFSSPAAFAGTLAQHEKSMTRGIHRQTAPLRRPSLGILRQQLERVEEEYADDEVYEEATGEAVETAVRLFREMTLEEREVLDKMRQWADSASHRPDSKTQTLIRWLHAHIKPGGKWSDERVIIFTEYRATQNWLQTILAAEGLATSERLLTLYGGMNSDERERIKAAFQADPKDSPVRILLATDAASEGIDLQRHCHRLIHIEIPWNPNRLEQRNGRIDRHGQNHVPLIYHFVGKGYQEGFRGLESGVSGLETDLEFLMRAAIKVNQIREDLGNVGPVEARRLSFRALDIEQIGHVYEGLLDHTAKRAETVILGLKGIKHRGPDIPLPKLEANREKDDKEQLKFLKDKTGRSTSALRNALQAEPDALTVQRLRVACGNDDVLYQRVLPFAGLIHADAFGQPLVIVPGIVYVTAGVERRMTGTHYTPRSLTEPIVQHTLEPLVYDGPAEGKSQGEWKLRPASDLLDLKICDMAMGSGAFLVQACRYLSERLVEAWELAEAKMGKRRKAEQVMITPEGKPTTNLDEAIPADTEERLILARRLIADRCLYGVDKNPLAVEMAKLSLWLITLDKNRPFTFLDHSLKCGDSLVGVSLKQLHNWSLDTSDTLKVFAKTIKLDIEKIISLRREISHLPVNSVDDQTHKRYLLTQADAIAHDLRQGGDMLLSSYFNDLSKAKQEDLRNALLPVFRYGADIPSDWTAHADLGDVRPFHWELEFPEVFLDDGRDGFDAFVGNPPFIGGRRIREALGGNYRGILYELYPGSKGNADYSSFFFLRGYRHLYKGGALGLIATNTIAQDDTRETGLDTIVEEGGVIYNATNNQPWPGMAAVVVNVVHIAKELTELSCELDGKSVGYISSLLDSRKLLGNPHQLVANQDRSFQGSVVVGTGFVLEPEEAQALIERNPRNKEVLFPYLNGKDLNSNPDQSPSRWVINLFDWPLRKGAQGSWFEGDEKQRKKWRRSAVVPNDYPDPVAADYPDCLAIVREKVYPVRAKVRRKPHREYWWHYGDKRPALYRTIASLQQVLIRPRVSETHAPVFVPKGLVYSEATVVFTFDDYFHFAVMQSSLHEHWVRRYASTLKGDIRYSPSDVFDTYLFPEVSRSTSQFLADLGETYHEHRRQIMLDRQEGLTKTYNRFHDPDETAADIQRLRELHVEMDTAVAAAYGWNELELGHDFHETQQGVRYTISESARREVLGRLLELNHQRYEEEVKAGLHNKKKASRK